MFTLKEGISQRVDGYTAKIITFLSSQVAFLRLLEEGQMGNVCDCVISRPSKTEAVALKTHTFSFCGLFVYSSWALESGSKFHFICIHIRVTLASVLDHP